eukprot:766682-Hanusia_phi.AAC.2
MSTLDTLFHVLYTDDVHMMLELCKGSIQRIATHTLLHRAAVTAHGSMRAAAAAQRRHAAQGDTVRTHAPPQDGLDPACIVRREDRARLPARRVQVDPALRAGRAGDVPVQLSTKCINAAECKKNQCCRAQTHRPGRRVDRYPHRLSIDKRQRLLRHERLGDVHGAAAPASRRQGRPARTGSGRACPASSSCQLDAPHGKERAARLRVPHLDQPVSVDFIVSSHVDKAEAKGVGVIIPPVLSPVTDRIIYTIRVGGHNLWGRGNWYVLPADMNAATELRRHEGEKKLTCKLYIKRLEEDIEQQKEEREKLQEEIELACTGLEKECLTLRNEVASSMKTNKELQDIIEKERKKNMTPSENITNEMTRLKQELERVTLEKQAADERIRENQVEIKRLQNLYTDEIEKSSSLRAKQLREIEETFSEAVAGSQLRVAELKEQEAKSNEKIKELMSDIQDLNSELQSIDKLNAELENMKEKLHHDNLDLTRRAEVAEDLNVAKDQELSMKRKEIETVRCLFFPPVQCCNHCSRSSKATSCKNAASKRGQRQHESPTDGQADKYEAVVIG